MNLRQDQERRPPDSRARNFAISNQQADNPGGIRGRLSFTGAQDQARGHKKAAALTSNRTAATDETEQLAV